MVDQCVDTLLRWIRGLETNDNYNAVSGNIRASLDLSQKTIDEILVLMDRLIRTGHPSSATGAYQILRKTLKRLLAPLSLKLTDLFTNEVQDKLAHHLLVERGFESWKAGEISDERFLHNLSCEWASIPDPLKEGRSHYDGVGQNHALTTLDAAYRVLDNSREAIHDPGIH